MSCLDVFNASNLVPVNQDTILAADIPYFYDRTAYIGDASLAGKQAPPPPPFCRAALLRTCTRIRTLLPRCCPALLL